MIVAYLIAANQAVFSCIALYCKPVSTRIEVDTEPTVVGGVRSGIRLRYLVVLDDGTGLIAQRVNTTGIIELAGIVHDLVAYDAVVLHARIVWRPSPADADAGVADAVHEVAADGAVAYISHRNSYGSPVLVGCINDEVLINGQPLAALRQVGIGTVYFARTLCKGTTHDGRAANVAEGAFLYRAVADVVDKVQGRGGQILEQHRVEVYVMGIAHGDSTHGAFYPCLVFQPFVPRQPWVFLQLVGINEWHAALQGDVTFVQRTVPACLVESDSFETHVVRSINDNQLLNAVALFGGAQQERRVTLFASDDGLWPWMFKLQATLGLHERNNGFIAIDLHLLDTQDGDGPPLVYHHFEIFGLEDVLGWSRNGDGSVGGIEVYDALHAFLWKTIIVFG